MPLKHTRFIFLILILIIQSTPVWPQTATEQVAQLHQLVKEGNLKLAEAQVKKLASINIDKLKLELNTENRAKAFWLNTYNGYVQYLLRKNPALFKNRNKFFSASQIAIAGEELSLEDIEHGIIRHSKNKYSFGYLTSFFIDDFEEKFRLQETDYRVHFALNCGAKSCPPVALYVAEKIEQQLDQSASLYLLSQVKFDVKKNIVWVPALCQWFKADFGGEEGVIKMLRHYKIIPADKSPDIEYLEYNWDLSLGNYITL